jgi:polysaccharide chain length determinant protein (PEP-CTERM system associated)
MDGVRELLTRKLRAIWHRRWVAIVTAWVICVCGWAGVMLIPSQYEASARLYVDSDAVLTPLLRGVTVESSATTELDVLQRTLLSRPNLEKLIAKTDLDLAVTGPAELERMVARLSTDIHVVPQTRNLFTITYRNTSPKVALEVVQTILTTFIESKVGNNRSDIENAQTFLSTQIENYERQLRDAEQKRAEFRTKYIDLLPGDGGGVSRYEQAQTSVRQLQGALEDAKARQAALTKELVTTQPMVVTEIDQGFSGGGGGGGANAARLAEAERVLSELRLRFTDQYPDVVAQRRLVESMRSGKGLSADPGSTRSGPSAPRSRSLPNPVYEQLRVRLVENDSIIASLERQVADSLKERGRLEEIARGAPGLQAEYINLNRDYDVVRKNYDELLARREQMRIASAADSEANKVKVQIVDPPAKPQTPVAPKRIILLSAVLAAGLASGVALVLMIDEIDASFQNVDDLRVLGLPVIGGISVIMEVVPLWRRVVTVGSIVTVMLLLCSVYGGLVYRLVQAGVA